MKQREGGRGSKSENKFFFLGGGGAFQHGWHGFDDASRSSRKEEEDFPGFSLEEGG